jgi:hypothetical protein
VNAHVGAVSGDQVSFVHLETAKVQVEGPDGKEIECRLLLDVSSQMNFISERLRSQFIPTTNRVNLTIKYRSPFYKK